jgi:hypothetical protein
MKIIKQTVEISFAVSDRYIPDDNELITGLTATLVGRQGVVSTTIVDFKSVATQEITTADPLALESYVQN